MKIQKLETMVCMAGWRPWAFLKVITDEGVVGFADCTDSHGSLRGVLETIHQFESMLEGRDPNHVEQIWWDLYRISRQSSGGVVLKAIAAIESALVDIKAKALGIPVYALLGGPFREKVNLYWSHCGSTRIRSHQHIGKAQVKSLEDLRALVDEVKERGYSGLKTNLLRLGEAPGVLMQGFKGGYGSTDRNLDNKVLHEIEEMVAAIRDQAGEDFDIILDMNMHFRGDGTKRLARVLEPYNLTWLECDLEDPVALCGIKEYAAMPLASGERLQTMRGYRPFFEAAAMDICLIDIKWNGIMQSKKVADLAETYDLNVAPHNHGSPLATLMSAHFAAAVSNLRVMEYDVDDIPWRDEIVTEAPQIEQGKLRLSGRPGWGAELNEALVRQHQI